MMSDGKGTERHNGGVTANAAKVGQRWDGSELLSGSIPYQTAISSMRVAGGGVEQTRCQVVAHSVEQRCFLHS